MQLFYSFHFTLVSHKMMSAQGPDWLLLPLDVLGQLADHYCHWFLELSFSRISESTTGYTCTPCVGSVTSPGIDTTHTRDHQLLVSLLKDTGKCWVTKLPKFQNGDRWD